jgi:hypothetical protein
MVRRVRMRADGGSTWMWALWIKSPSPKFSVSPMIMIATSPILIRRVFTSPSEPSAKSR